MKVVINGKNTELAEPITVAELLSRHELHPSRVAVEINREILPKKSYQSVQVNSGDQIEIVTFVGGG
jgi:sulfur carrier protein